MCVSVCTRVTLCVCWGPLNRAGTCFEEWAPKDVGGLQSEAASLHPFMLPFLLSPMVSKYP